MEGRVLVLRHLLDLAVELGGRGLVDAARVGEPQLTYGLEDAQHADGIDIGRELGRVERHLYVALCGQVVDLGGAHAADDAQDAHGVAQVGVVQVEVGSALEVGYALAEVD